MNILVCTILLLSKNLSGEFPEMLRSRPHRPAVLDPCIKTKCPKISTALLSKREFLRLKNISQSEKMKIQEHSWTKILRKRRKQRSLNQRRTKRSSARTIVSLNTKHKTYHSNKKCHKYAVFKVFGEDFTLCLLLGDFLADPMFSQSEDLRVAVYGEGDHFRSRSLSSMFLQVAEGHILGQVFSSVRGYVWRDKFYGTVVTSTDTLHIEPLLNVGPVNSKYIRGINRAVNAYVYRVFSKSRSHKQIRETGGKAYKLYKAGRWRELKKHYKQYYKKLRLRFHRSAKYKQFAGKISERVKRVKRGASSCRSCSLLLIADSSFYEEVGQRSIKQSVLQMLFHVREANLLMKTQDFDRDGTSDCVGVHVSGIGVITSNTSVDNLLSGTFSTPEDYLRTFSRYQLDGYCLAVLFSNKVFPGKVLGLSWKGEQQKASGICQSRTNVGTSEKPEMYNLNSLFITLRTKKARRIPLRMGVLNLAHELFHSFGAGHDPDTNECRPRDQARNGRYIMSKFSSSGVKGNNEVISNCTARSIHNILESTEMSYCLHPHQGGYCGDGVVDLWEECDCGGMERCLEMKSSCTPPGLRRGEIECHFRKLAHYSSKSNAIVRKKKVKKNTDCSRLGLQHCPCPGSRNSVTCTSCCGIKGEDCRPAKQWTSIMFDHMQHYLAMLCWGDTVSTCISTSHKWRNVLGLLSKSQLKGQGEIFCLKTARDSNCWQLPFYCDKNDKSSKKMF